MTEKSSPAADVFRRLDAYVIDVTLLCTYLLILEQNEAHKCSYDRHLVSVTYIRLNTMFTTC